MAKRLIVYTAATGSRFHRGQNPHLPFTIDEVIEDIQGCYDAGSRYYHYHSLTDDGRHISLPDKYEAIGNWVAQNLPDMRLSFATSRGGQVNNQVMEFLNRQYGVPLKGSNINNIPDEQFLAAELVRAGCLTLPSGALPYACTTMTGAEIRMAKENETGNAGYIDPRGTSRVQLGFEYITRLAAARGVVGEVEMTTYTTNGKRGIEKEERDFDSLGPTAPASSFKVLMDLVKKDMVGSPLSIVLLPGFSDGLPLKSLFIHKAIDDAAAILTELRKRGGDGWITLGGVITPNKYEEPLEERHLTAQNLNPARQKILKIALDRPEVSATRVGMEDAPWWRNSDGSIEPKSNTFYVQKTVTRIRELGGEIITDPKEMDAIIGRGNRAQDPILNGGSLGELSARIRGELQTVRGA